ncbi:MAG TPA: hypothetical protein VFY45_04100 [Baekduia sp.]|nr:hypothetical protein [Baekduia sp.]
MSRRDRRRRDAKDEQQRTGPLLWGSTASKAITSAGAIAGAIIAIVGVGKLVIPDKQPSNPHDSVSIRAVQAIPQSLSDFHPTLRHEREADGSSVSGSGTIVLAANVLKLLAQVTDALDPTTPTPVEPPVPTTTTTAPPPPSTTPTTNAPDNQGTTSSPSPSTAPSTTVLADTRSHDRPAERADAQVLAPEVPVVLPEATTSADFVDAAATIVETAQPLVPDVNIESCDRKIDGVCMAILFMLGAISVDREGRAVAPEVAAKRIATVLNRTRTVEVGGRRVPLGLLVTTKVRLVALSHRDVSLTWSVLPIDGQGALGPVWRGPNLSYRLSAEDDDDRVVVPLWIPLPKRKGRYIVRLDVFRGDTDLEQADSKPFRSR